MLRDTEVCHLEAVSFPEIHETFVAAFADYAVGVAAVTEDQFRRRTRKNGWQPGLSSGIRIDGQLVAITLIGTDQVEGEHVAYDICTGILPAHRGRGLAGTMLDDISPRLKKAAFSVMQLEVLQNNTAAIRAYEKAGFRIIRALPGFENLAGSVNPSDCNYPVRKTGLDDIAGLESHLEARPSFEQRRSAIEILEDELIMLGAFNGSECIGAIAFDPQTGWIMRLVVDLDHRRQRIGSTLVHHLAQRLDPDSKIRAVNVDGNDVATASLLEKCGFSGSHKQWEMRLELGG